MHYVLVSSSSVIVGVIWEDVFKLCSLFSSTYTEQYSIQFFHNRIFVLDSFVLIMKEKSGETKEKLNK